MPRARALGLPGSRRLLGALSDERLVAAVRAGNERAFEVLYDRHHRGVLGFCRHMLGSSDEAEDAVQQTFLSAHRDMLRDDKEIRFKAWIYTIARNRCLSLLRSRREHSSDEIEVAVDRLSDDVAQRAELQDLLRDIAELPDRQRAALVLSEVADLSHAEVAKVVECEVAQVKSLVFQARSSLIDRRNAREVPCEQIREELATLKGGALRRSHLRHHVKACPGCAAFREDVRRQRQMLAVALPVFPSLGLKDSVLASIGIGGGAGGAGAAVGGGALAAKGGIGLAAHGLAAKAAVVAVVAGGAAGGGAVLMETRDGGTATPATAVAPGVAAGGDGSGGPGAAAGGDDGQGDERSSKRKGFTPVKGESNGERARDFAATRGRGEKKGLSKSRAERAKAQKLRAERARRRQVRRRAAEERAAQPPARTAPRERPETTRPMTPPADPVPTAEAEPEPAPQPVGSAPELPQSTGKPLKLK